MLTQQLMRAIGQHLTGATVHHIIIQGIVIVMGIAITAGVTIVIARIMDAAQSLVIVAIEFLDIEK